MGVEPELVGVVHILAALVALAFLRPALSNRGTPGSRPFAVFCVAVAVYAFGAGADLFVADYALSAVLYGFRLVGGPLVSAAWLVLAVERTDRYEVDRRLLAGVGAYVLAAALLTATNPFHGLVFSGTLVDGVNFTPENGAVFWVLLTVGYSINLLGTGLLGTAALRSTGLRRRQLGTLALAIVPFFLGSVLAASGATVYDWTSPGYLLSATVFAWALYSRRFLDLAPVGRRTALDEIDDGMVTVDEENRVVDANTAARELFGVDGGYAGMDAAALFEPIPPALRTEMLSSERLDTEVTVPMGEQRRHFSLSVTPVGREGERGRVYVFRDITPQKRRQRRLERQNERLDQFASVVSHDIRNPLNVAQGRLAVVREEIPEEHAGAMERSLDRIEGMVDDLLTLARAGQTVEETESVRPAAVAREAWDHTDAAGADLELSLPVGFSVEADRDRLLHVFENLFRNAVDHNDGPVTVRVGTPARETPTDGGHPAALFVEDDGEGIPEAQRETVFDHGYTTSDTGTGFGLSIVSDVVGAHGWEVEVTEGTDGGARFEITGVTPAE